MTLWRNGSASDSRSEGCVFKSRRGQFLHYFLKHNLPDQTPALRSNSPEVKTPFDKLLLSYETETNMSQPYLFLILPAAIQFSSPSILPCSPSSRPCFTPSMPCFLSSLPCFPFSLSCFPSSLPTSFALFPAQLAPIPVQFYCPVSRLACLFPVQLAMFPV